MPKSPLATLRRQQLSDICVAFGLEVDRDATKDELLQVALGAERQGKFAKPARDPYRLMKASKSSDDWRSYRDGGGVMPPFEEPDVERYAAGTYQALQTKASSLGLNPLHKTKAQLQAMIAEVEGVEQG